MCVFLCYENVREGDHIYHFDSTKMKYGRYNNLPGCMTSNINNGNGKTTSWNMNASKVSSNAVTRLMLQQGRTIW